jgi:hypothetical protein
VSEALVPSNTNFVRPKRDPDKIAFAKNVYNLLQRPSHARPQTGDSYGKGLRITCDDFEDHLFGGVTLAVAVACDFKANFLSFDCDEDFPRRLAIYARVLAARGLDKAAFITTGSTPERGKIVVTLAERIPQAHAVKLAKEIQEEVKADPDFGVSLPSKLTCFPSNGKSFCRVLGRKYPDPAPFERFLDRQGRPMDPSCVVPAQISAPTNPVNVPGRGLSALARTAIQNPFMGNTPAVFKTQIRLADEAIRLFGTEAESKFLEWMEIIAKNSPEASTNARRQLLRKDVFTRVSNYITSWEPLARKPSAWKPYLLAPLLPFGLNARANVKGADRA